MVEFITENWESILALLAALHALAVAIVNLTPTPKDDEVLAKVYRVVEVLAGLFTKRTKGAGSGG